MKRFGPWVGLFALALVFGLATGTGAPDDSPTASIGNPGPQGLKVLHTWLAEGGSQVRALTQPLTTLPSGVEVVVIAAPTQRAVTQEEVQALEAFVQQGGTLIYLSPRPARSQPQLQRWLALEDESSRRPELKDAVLDDVGGAQVSVAGSYGVLRGVHQLRVSSDTGLFVNASDAVAVAGHSLWVRPLGQGEVWIAAGADLAENRRLDLLDNLQLWSNLRTKQIAFDEFHFVPPPTPRWSANLWASLVQFIFLGLLFVAARAPRLGPARPTPSSLHRSSLEYVTSMGALMQRAGVEGELKLKLRERLRRLMHERLGISLALSAEEASRMLASHSGVAPEAFLQLDLNLRDDSGPFLVAAQQAARLEDIIVGRMG